jgi:predicted ATPase
MEAEIHPSKPTLYILCGLPFSGKTTLARALADRCGFVHTEVPIWMIFFAAGTLAGSLPSSQSILMGGGNLA